MKYSLTAALAMLALVATAFTAGNPPPQQGEVLIVDGVEYSSTKETPGTVHWYTPTPNPTAAAYGDQQWNGKNGAEHLPCDGLVHWVSNKSRLVISHCESDETTTTVPDETTTTVPDETTTTTTVPDETTTTTVPDELDPPRTETSSTVLVPDEVTIIETEITVIEEAPLSFAG